MLTAGRTHTVPTVQLICSYFTIYFTLLLQLFLPLLPHLLHHLTLTFYITSLLCQLTLRITLIFLSTLPLPLALITLSERVVLHEEVT